MDEKEFMRQQAAATERMRRMHERSQFKEDPHTMPPTPDFVRVGGKEASRQYPEHSEPTAGTSQNRNGNVAKKSEVPAFSGENFLTAQLREPDTALILGLLLLLFSENADRRLLFALLYILM